MYDARMPFRAPWAVVWLAIALSSGAHAAVLRDNLYGVKAISANDAWAVGNYGESFERNLGSGSRLKIPRGINALWKNGGLHYPPPIR